MAKQQRSKWFSTARGLRRWESMAPMSCFISLNPRSRFSSGPSRNAASTKSDNDSFENDLAIGGNYRRSPIEKLVEFHVRLLSRLNEHEENIAQAPCGYKVISTCNTIIYIDRFDIAKWLLTAWERIFSQK